MNKIEGLGVDFYVNEKDEKRLTLDFIGEIRLQMDVDDAFDDDILRINLSILDKVVERRSLRIGLKPTFTLRLRLLLRERQKYKPPTGGILLPRDIANHNISATLNT